MPRQREILMLMVGVAGLAGTLAFLASRPAALRRAPTLQDQQELRRQQIEEFRRNGLHAAARITGSFRHTISYPSEGGPVSLAELVQASDGIAVGATNANVCRPTRDGRSIITIYEVKIEFALKGSFAPGSSISLIVLGGQVGFPDGTTARLDTPGFSRPTAPLRRIFFFHAGPEGVTEGNETYLVKGQGFVPTSGPLGIYDLSGSHGMFVNPSGNFRNPMATAIGKAKLTPPEFLDEVRNILQARR